MRLDALEVSDAVLDKMEAKHGVSLEEAEAACVSLERHVRRRS